MTLRARARGARGEPNEFRMGEKLKWALLLSINGAHNTFMLSSALLIRRCATGAPTICYVRRYRGIS